MPEITLLCWILGEDLNSVFPIGIENHKVVGDLKVKIREENLCTLKHIDARVLALSIVDIDLNEMDTQSLNSHVVEDGVDNFNRLDAWTQISELWEFQPSTDRLQIIIRLPPAKKEFTPIWNVLISRTVLEKLQRALLDLIPWIAALYFIIKSLQASAAQAYASLLQSGTPDFIVGYISNISTSDNLKSYGDMINFHAVNFMLISAGIIVALTVLCHLVFAFIFEVL